MHTPRIFMCLAALCLSGAFVVAQSGSATPAAATPVPTLADLEARAPKSAAEINRMEAFAPEVVALVGSNTLATGDDFYRAANLLVWGNLEFRVRRVQYELLLAAAAQGNLEAEKSLPRTWDNLMRDLGRPFRFDPWELAKKRPQSFELEAAPACIRSVWLDPVAARATAAAATDNPELKAIVDADQAARKDGSFRTEEGIAADHARNARTREIVAAGELRTAGDFANASLVLQHGARFSSFQLAHELGVSALLLGDRGRGRSIVTAAYDRMLRSVGHDQRFGTQQTMAGPPLRVDEEGISDNQRVALGRPTLAKAREYRRQP